MTSPASRSRRPRCSRFLGVSALAALSLMSVACQAADTTDASSGIADLPPAEAATSTSGAGTSDAGTSDAGTSNAGTSNAAPTEAEIEEAQLAFEQCLADAGLDADFGGGGGGESIGGDEGAEAQAFQLETDEDPEAFEEALDECNKALEGVAGSFEPSPEQEAAFRDAEAAFVNCMAENGIEIDFEDGGFALESLEEDEVDKQEAAINSCSEKAFGDGIAPEGEDG